VFHSMQASNEVLFLSACLVVVSQGGWFPLCLCSVGYILILFKAGMKSFKIIVVLRSINCYSWMVSTSAFCMGGHLTRFSAQSQLSQMRIFLVFLSTSK
jgi:hypothetical protein